MSLPSQDTFLNLLTPLTVIGGGGGGQVSTFDNVFVTSTLTALDIVSFNISTTYLEADNAIISSISTLGIYLDGALLTTAGGSELLLNGIPVATTTNISSLADWAFDPAISTVQLNGNDILGGRDLQTDNIATNQISTTSMFIEAIYSPIGYDNQLNIYGYTGVIIQSDGIGANINLLNVLDPSVGSNNEITLSTNVVSLQATQLIDMQSENLNMRATLVEVEADVITLIATDIFAGDSALGTTTFITGNISSFEIKVQNGITIGDGGNLNLSGFGTVRTDYIDGIDGLVIARATELNGLDNQLAITGLSTINGQPFAGLASTFNTSSITASSGNFSTLDVKYLTAELISSSANVMSSLVCPSISQVVEINAAPTELGGVVGVLAINGLSTVNGLPYPTSQFSTVTAPAIITSSITTQNSLGLTINGSAGFVTALSQGMSNVIDRGADFGGNAFYRLTAQNGNAGEISFTAEPGILGNYGRIGLTANGGTLIGTGVVLGGLVEITATTPFGSLCNASSAIKLSAAGINSYAGAVPSVGSLTGYNFIYGTLGVNLAAGLPPGALPNTPGTVYLYGATGVVSGSPFYAYEILGYWNGLAPPSNLRITGRQTISGNSQVVVSNVDSIFFDTGYGALSGVSSINGTAYPPSVATPSNLDITSLNATSSITADAATFSTLNNISSVNGSSYPPTFAVPEILVVSSLTAANYVSTTVLEGVSSIVAADSLIIQMPGNITSEVQITNPYSENSLLINSTLTVFADTLNSSLVGIVGGYPQMIGPLGSKVEFDTFGNIQLSTLGATILSPDTGVVNIGNAGTFNFDPLGYKAINGLSTINGVAYPLPTVQPSSISRAGGSLVVNSDGSISQTSLAEANISFDSLGQLSLRTASSTLTEQMSLIAASTIYISSGSSVVMTPELDIAALTGVSSINSQPYIPGSAIIPYSLTGTKAAAVIVNRGSGATSSLTQNVFTSTSQITFNLPSVIDATESIYYDGWMLADFDSNFNSFWGVSYYTNTFATPTDILGSTSVTANALNFTNIQQIYLPLNVILPPTHLTGGGTVTLTIYCNPTSANHYLTVAPTNTARIGIVSD